MQDVFADYGAVFFLVTGEPGDFLLSATPIVEEWTEAMAERFGWKLIKPNNEEDE
jgi:hypothetical protein